MSMQASKWRITSLINKPLLQPHLHTVRFKTLPDIRISCKKIEETGKNQVLRTNKRYSSAELQLKIRSKIVSVKSIEPPFHQQGKQKKVNQLPKLQAEYCNQKKKYLFNFYHRSKQLSMRRPNHHIQVAL